MKKTLLLISLVCLFIGCSKDEPVEPTVFETVPVLSVEPPEALTPGIPVEFSLTYSMPTECHEFTGLRFEENQNTVLFAVVTQHGNLDNCSDTGTVEEIQFEFVAKPNFETYTFKFWTGPGPSGEGEFLTLEVPVQ